MCDDVSTKRLRQPKSLALLASIHCLTYMKPAPSEIGVLFGAGPPENLAPVTPGVSKGTKMLDLKLFVLSFMIIFRSFSGVVLQKKLLKNEKSVQFRHILQ